MRNPAAEFKHFHVSGLKMDQRFLVMIVTKIIVPRRSHRLPELKMGHVHIVIICKEMWLHLSLFPCMACLRIKLRLKTTTRNQIKPRFRCPWPPPAYQLMFKGWYPYIWQEGIRMKRLYSSKHCMKCMVVPRQELDLIQICKSYQVVSTEVD